MSFARLYARVLGLLRPVLGLVFALAAANVALAFTQFGEPLLFGKVVDRIAGAQSTGATPQWAEIAPPLALWAAFGVFSIVASVWVSLHADRLAHRRRLAAMGDYFEHVMNLPIGYHLEAHSGRLLKVMIEGSNGMFSVWLSFFREHCAGFVALFVLLPSTLFVNWRLGAILVALVIVFAAAMNHVIRRTESLQGKATDISVMLAERVLDVLGNMPVIQSFARTGDEARALRTMGDRLLDAQLPVLTWWAIANVATRSSSTLSLLAIFILGVWLDIRGLTTIGQIVAFMTLATGLIGRLEQIVGFVNFMFSQAPQLAQFFAVLDAKSSVAERPGAVTVGRLVGHVRFERVDFSYGGGRNALREVSFDAPAGRTIALVGATGSGKSTTLALLHRVFDPTGGRVTIDGRDIRDMTLASLRSNIGVVFQEPFLFARSIEENLRIGKPDASAAEIALALARAQADGFVDAQPHGLATIVGERGRNLSGGERQRLAIARALLKDPPIMVLDEATSALDAATETRLQQALDAATKGRTTFVIAHRLATIRNADLILVFDGGRIVESGAFDALVEKGGAFAALAKAQFMTKSAAGQATVTEPG
jgi:ATP-binding cassette subfamily B protein